MRRNKNDYSQSPAFCIAAQKSRKEVCTPSSEEAWEEEASPGSIGARRARNPIPGPKWGCRPPAPSAAGLPASPPPPAYGPRRRGRLQCTWSQLQVSLARRVAVPTLHPRVARPLPHLHTRAAGYLHFPPAPDSTTTAAVPALPALPPRASVLRKASLATSSRPFSSHHQRGVPVSHQQRARQEGKADGGPGSRLPPRLPCGLHAWFPGQK